jgi:hypothetical protein
VTTKEAKEEVSAARCWSIIEIPEIAGPFWSGWAMGKQNTFERFVVAVAPPVFAELITVFGYPLAFAVSGLFPLAAVPLLPVDDQPDQAEKAVPS